MMASLETIGMQDLDRELDRLNNHYQQQMGYRVRIEEEIARQASSVAQSKHSVLIMDEAKGILEAMSDRARAEAKEKIEKLVSGTLSAIFGPEYGFEIEIKQTGESRKRPNAVFHLVKTIGIEKMYIDPISASGGGVVDIISMVLRLSLIQLFQKGNASPVIIMDEPAKHVSSEYIYRVLEMLRGMVDEFDFQVIAVTHNQVLANGADMLYRTSTTSEGCMIERAQNK